MGKLGFARICSFKGIFRLCLCLVLVGIIIFGAAGSATAASATGSAPQIRVFTADPLILPDGGHAVYMFEVYDATKIQVIENGEIINEYNGPPSTTSKGKSTGRTTYQIRMGNMDTFDTVLRVSNPGGQREQKLSISFATKFVPKPAPLPAGQTVTDNRTAKHESKWGPQLSAPASLASSTALPSRTEPPYVPTYAECPSGCNCLTPDQAEEYGFKQKCFEQRCFSADNQVKSYCYSKLATGWCCKDGKVTPATEAQCKEAGGSYWSTDQAQVIKVCQPELGWFCSGNKVYQGSQAQATQVGATWYATQAEATRACEQCWCCRKGTAAAASQVTQMNPADCAKTGGNCYNDAQTATQACESPVGYCCSNGQLTGPVSQTQCAQMKGTYYTSLSQGKELCQPSGYCCTSKGVTGPVSQTQCAQMGGSNWSTSREQVTAACQPLMYYCCRNGQVYQSTTPGTGCYTSPTQAQQACQRTYWCCSNGQVYQSTTLGRGCYTSQTEAQQACTPPPTPTYWCCRNGQVYQSKTPGTGCYSTQAEATRACQKLLAPPIQR